MVFALGRIQVDEPPITLLVTEFLRTLAEPAVALLVPLSLRPPLERDAGAAVI